MTHEAENITGTASGQEKKGFNPLLSKARKFDRQYALWHRLGLTPGKEVRAFDYAIAGSMAKEQLDKRHEEVDKNSSDTSGLSFFRRVKLGVQTERFRHAEAVLIVISREAKAFIDNQFSEEEMSKIRVFFNAARDIHLASLESDFSEETVADWSEYWKEELNSRSEDTLTL